MGRCKHGAGTFSLQGISKPWVWSCPDCGLEGRGESPREALSAFGLEDERNYVEALILKRNVGWGLAAHEERAIAYSSYGTAASCNVRHARSFLLGST